MRKQTIYVLGFLFILNACFGIIHLFHYKHAILIDFGIFLLHSFAIFIWIKLIINTFTNEN